MFQSITVFGHAINLYNPLNTIAYLAAFLLLFIWLDKYKSICTLPALANVAFLKKGKQNFIKKWFFYALEVVVISVIIIGVTSPLNDPVSLLFLGDKSSNFFPIIFFVPIITFLCGVVFYVSPLRLTDLYSPLMLLILIIVKFSCFCEGCCYGVACETGGLYNYKNDRYEVPVQLIEMGCAVIMFVVILLIQHKKRRKPGILYPLFILMYCGSRFVSEFWRGDYPAVWGRLTGYHIQCIIGFVEGALFLFVALKWGEQITVFFENRNKAFLDRQLAKIEAKRSKTKHSKKKRTK